MNAKSLQDLLAGGSASFRRLNTPAPQAVPARGSGQPRAHRPVAPTLPHPEPKQDAGRALERLAEEEGRSIPPSARRPNVHIALHRVRLLDRDNKWASVKFLVDGLCKAGLIKDDSEQDIDLRVTQTKVASYNLEGTGVVITYR